MIRRLAIPLLGSGLLLAASAGSALAKCEGPNPPAFCSEVIVSMNVAGGGTLQAGTAESVDVSVSEGEQPLPAMGVVLTFSRLADGTEVRVYATATSVPGLWSAEVNLPDGGGWTARAQVVTNTGADYLVQVQTSSGVVMPVGSPPKPPVTTPTAPPVTPAAPAWPIVLGLGFIAAALLGGGAAWGRTRRRTAGAAGSAAANATTADRA
jgi:hypothetical protein